eukprot:CAMPEP_0178411032 /NCGR_PEP_ID=MMETSP0689_2-20121128/21287_1 /TAXON_ID=160604 /ORGANISM="Amphidinium massartii, Strain CS-259" /LENGTH=496 /DNA_ID=CAMNT_0020032229 /DNA_START=13 /DNA_END=1499 /DNA_ORIENTATION=-
MPPPVIEPLPIKDAFTATFPRFADRRGYFNELFNRVSYPEFVRGSIAGDWKQVSTSLTLEVGTVRGLHLSPYNKFCTVVSGAIYDVIVDVREDSPTFLKWCASYVSEENRKQVHVPAYCLHAIMALQPGTRLLYLQGGTFQPKLESDCTPFEELFGIHWPVSDLSKMIISDRDRNAPAISADSRMPQLKGRARPKRVLVIGASGQVGGAIVKDMEKNGYLVYGTHTANPAEGQYTIKFDLEAAAKEPNLADELLSVMRPDIVIICAAFTAVDAAEDNKEKVYAINVKGPEAVALAAKKIGAKLVVYSTEYVWDGTSGPYREDHPISPTNVYGESKAAMEKSLVTSYPSSLILRTTVVYGPEKQGKNFLYQLCRKLGAGETMKVVSDQISSPTYNRDLATLTRMLLEADAAGIFNACGLEVLSRYDFAIAAAKALGLDPQKIQPSLTADYNQKAKRPLKAGMSMDKAKALLGSRFHMRSVQEAIADWKASQVEGDAP